MRVITIGNIKAAASIVASAEALTFTLVLLGLERRYFIQVSEITVRTKQMATIDQFANRDSSTLFSIEISSLLLKLLLLQKYLTTDIGIAIIYTGVFAAIYVMAAIQVIPPIPER